MKPKETNSGGRALTVDQAPQCTVCRHSEMPTLGVYIQFPFCASKCSFCNFSSKVDSHLAYGPYIQALELEIGLLASGLTRRGVHPDFLASPPDSIYCGGGTPSLAGSEGLSRIFSSLQQTFRVSGGVEWTVEITPGSADDDLLSAMLELGVNRLSIGAQSFNDRELSSVGRLHSSSDTGRLVALARQAGYRNISLDLIAGLPYQTEASWHRSLDEVLMFRPEHVSIYLFEVDERSRLGREVIAGGGRYHASAIPGDDFVAEAYDQAREALAREGYSQYEISNFALPGHESRHNQKYWQLQPYLGLGAGAHSFDGVRRWSNDVEPDRYRGRLRQGELPLVEMHSLSPSEQMEEFFFLGLRQCQGLSLDFVRRRWSRPPLNWWEDRVRTLKEQGFLRERDGWLSLNEGAYLISNEIFEQFLM
jgi:oxygen-independent coproporphyrinogen III oxidase